MAGASQEFYPRGQIAIGNGPWGTCTNAKFDMENGADFVDTMGGTGITSGPLHATATFDTAIGTNGQDFDTLKKIKNHETVQVRFKFPVGRSITITGTFDKTSFDFPIDKPITESLSMKGVPEFI
jgi:hypothetical protein